MAAAAGDGAPAPPLYLVLTNVGKTPNVRDILTSAAAFGVAHVFVVGMPRFDVAAMSAGRVPVSRFESLEACKAHVSALGAQLVGVEIADGARSVAERPFAGPTAVMMGNEGAGMNEKQLRLCDALVYIPQVGAGTASLNVATACGLIMHEFVQWQGVEVEASRRAIPRSGAGDGGSDGSGSDGEGEGEGEGRRE